MPRPGFQTNVKVTAFELIAWEEIRQYDPKQRNCYFPDEHQLQLHQSYSQSSCMFECEIEYAAKCLTTCNKLGQTCECENHEDLRNNKWKGNLSEKCVPWIFPFGAGNVKKMCNPWNTIKFKDILDNQIPRGLCEHCLSDCFTTKYDTSVSYAELLKCDGTTIGSSRKLCDLISGELNPAPWTNIAQNEFTAANESIPWYLETISSNLRMNSTIKFSDERSRIEGNDVQDN